MEVVADSRIPEGAGEGVAGVVEKVKLHDASNGGDDDDLGPAIAENDGAPPVEMGVGDRDRRVGLAERVAGGGLAGGRWGEAYGRGDGEPGEEQSAAKAAHGQEV